MNNQVLATFQQASFRGVPFLFKNNSQSSGRKNKIFEYPKRNQRSVSDLGRLQKTYKMTATIFDSSSLYKNSRQALIDALEQEGSGILVHPIEGTKVVFALPYTLDDGISHLGTAIFNISFVETGPQIFPTKTPSSISDLVQNLNDLIASINALFISFWLVLAKFLGNIEYSANLIKALVDLFSNSGTLVTNDVKAYSSFIKNLTNLDKNRFAYTTNAPALVNNIQDVFSDAGQLGTTPSDNSIIMESFFNFNSAPPVDQITVATEQREKNRVVTNQLVNSMGLSYFCLFAVNTVFSNEGEILSVHKKIDDQFISIIINNNYTDILGNSFEILNAPTLSNLEDLRINAHEALNSQIATSRKVIDIAVQNESLLRLTYSYYQNLDFYDTLYDLNGLVSAANITGQFKVVTDEN